MWLKELEERVQLERGELRRERAEERERRGARDKVHPDAELVQVRGQGRVDAPVPPSPNLAPGVRGERGGGGVGAVGEGDLERGERGERETGAEDGGGLRAVRDEVGHGAHGGRDEDVRVEGALRAPHVPEAGEAVCGEAVQPLDVFPHDERVRAGVQGEEVDEGCEVRGCLHRAREEEAAPRGRGGGRVGGGVTWAVADGVVQQHLSGDRPGAADERGDTEGRVCVQMVEDLEEDVVVQSSDLRPMSRRHGVGCQRHPVCTARCASSVISTFYTQGAPGPSVVAISLGSCHAATSRRQYITFAARQ